MLFEDNYKTIASPSEGIFKDRGSKFIGYAFPVNSEQNIKALIQQLQTEHPKARHFCWALRISPDRSVFRLNDDGEPSGTAGRPILNTLLSNELTNILVVVVRYFGGTLLGVPGLINAYKTATLEAIHAAQIIEKTVNDVYLLKFNYLQLNEVMKLVKDENLTYQNQNFDTICSLEISVRKTQLNNLLLKLENISGLSYSYLGSV
ncbi:IMPACT family protein [Daejeonella oryzae]|uniref:IMPACT family protein n=1 Tax=Daejeonella oryzae TaxID=1122943 RepID=UPI00042A2C7C|nr:YigZ family protein [Daejeonella oryzae]